MESKRTWIINCSRYGFKYVIFVNSTEDRLHKYMETELPEATCYSGATDAEIEAARKLGLPIYLY